MDGIPSLPNPTNPPPGSLDSSFASATDAVFNFDTDYLNWNQDSAFIVQLATGTDVCRCAFSLSSIGTYPPYFVWTGPRGGNSAGSIGSGAVTVSAVPEPGTISLTLIGVGLLGLLALMRKRIAQGLAQTT